MTILYSTIRLSAARSWLISIQEAIAL